MFNPLFPASLSNLKSSNLFMVFYLNSIYYFHFRLTVFCYCQFTNLRKFAVFRSIKMFIMSCWGTYCLSSIHLAMRKCIMIDITFHLEYFSHSPYKVKNNFESTIINSVFRKKVAQNTFNQWQGVGKIHSTFSRAGQHRKPGYDWRAFRGACSKKTRVKRIRFPPHRPIATTYH